VTYGMKISEGESAIASENQRAAGMRRFDSAEGGVSLAGQTLFRSHRHKGQRVATEYTMWAKPTQLLLMHALILKLQAARNLWSSRQGFQSSH